MAPDEEIHVSTTATTETRNDPGADRRTVGTVGLVTAGILVVGNAIHPFDGSTEMYADITAFAEKASSDVWVIDHLVLAVVLLAIPWIASVWRDALQEQQARLWGGFAVVAVLIGTAIGTVHLGGVDGAAMGSYGALLDDPASGEMAVAAGEVLLRVHMATFTSWVLSFYAVAQLLLARATWLEGRHRWLGAVLAVGGLLAAASVVATAGAGQLTTLSEPLLFRPSTVSITLWLVVASLDLRKGHGAATR